MMDDLHTSILTTEISDFLKPTAGDYFVDATLGDGGHTAAILSQGTKVVAIDQDEEAIERAFDRLHGQLPDKKIMIATNRPIDVLSEADCLLVKANFAQIGEVASNLKVPPLAGVIFDLGVSTHQLLEARRGFSLLKEGPLDMRMDSSLQATAADLINGLSEKELANLFFKLGDEVRAKTYAKRIVAARESRPITTTTQLATIIGHNAPSSRIHPATKVFQALRMAVNLERDALTRALPAVVPLLKEGGILCVISFHSGEDRIVKQFLTNEKNLKALTPKPIVPHPAEVKRNPRSRSAKLRVATKI